MELIRKCWPKGLAGKLIRFVIIFVVCLGIVFWTISYVQVALLKDTVKVEEENRSELVETEFKDSMSEFSQDFLLEMITWAADKTDDEFWIIEHDITSLGAQVESVFRNPENYERIPVLPPSKENAGKCVLQILYPEGEENADSGTIEMLERLANLAPLMKEIVSANENSTYDVLIAMPDGVTIVMDSMSDKKFESDGSVIDYDPRTRPWYIGAVEKGGIYYTSAVSSAMYDFDEVIFGAPVYVDGELVAVIEGATNLNVLKEMLNERNVGKEGFSVLISNEGQLVCSPRTSGELKMRDDPDEDIRGSISPELLNVIECALSGETGVDIVHVDDELFYVAHSRLETVGWVQLSFVSASELMEPTNRLLSDMEESTDNLLRTVSDDFRKAVLLMVAVLLVFMSVSIAFASFMAQKRVAPIQHMTESVGGFAGDDMNFEMEDIYRTGDEIEDLAVAFENMSLKLKKYVQEIVEYASEQERIEAEMDAASQIQAQMLPMRDPDFTGKPEYELYGMMTPAKHVGGDLYDFFYLDDDHLVITVGDVSGKGITAALFMALSKQMIKSQMLLHGGDLVAAVTEANKRLCEESVEAMFVTVWIGVVTLSTGVLEFVNGGHLYAAVKRAGGMYSIEEDEHSIILGGLSFAKFRLNTMTLGKGDELFLYTDGVTEAHNRNDEMFGEKRLLEALNEVTDMSLEERDDHVRRKVSEFADGIEQYDDITTLSFKYLGITPFQPT